MSSKNTIADLNVSQAILLDFLTLSMYSLFLLQLRSLRSIHRFLYTHKAGAQASASQNAARATFLTQQTSLALACVRTLDFCTLSVYACAYSLAYVSAADSKYAAFALFVVAILLPFGFLDYAWDLRTTIVERAKTNRASTAGTATTSVAQQSNGASSQQSPFSHFWATALGTMPCAHKTFVAVPKFLAFCLLVTLSFIGILPRLTVREDIAALMNDTKFKFTFAAYRLRAHEIVSSLILVLPKRLSRDPRSALVCVPVLAAFLLTLFVWRPGVFGDPGSYELAQSTVSRYVVTEWPGRWFVAIAVVYSSIVWIFNPLWALDISDIRDAERVGEELESDGQSVAGSATTV